MHPIAPACTQPASHPLGPPRPGRVLRSAVFWAHVGQQKLPCRSLDSYKKRRFCLLLPPWSSSLPSLLSGSRFPSTLPVPQAGFCSTPPSRVPSWVWSWSHHFSLLPNLPPGVISVQWFQMQRNSGKPPISLGARLAGTATQQHSSGPLLPPQLPCGAPAPQVSLKSSPESLRVTLSRSTHPFPLWPRDLGLCQYSNWQVSCGRRQKVLGLTLKLVHHVKAPGHLCQRRRKRRCCRHRACCCRHCPE